MLRILPVLIATACGSSSKPVETPSGRAGPSASEAPADPTLDADLDRVAAYLAGGQPFTSVELVGWTAARAIVYRIAICDPDELGGRGAYCIIELCTNAAGAAVGDAKCEPLVDLTVSDKEPLDKVKASSAIRAAETAAQPTTRGKAENASEVSVTDATGDLVATAPGWFGSARWTLMPATPDPDTREKYGSKNAAVASVRSNGDGCLAFGVTGLRQARYESVVGSIRYAFVAQRCR